MTDARLKLAREIAAAAQRPEHFGTAERILYGDTDDLPEVKAALAAINTVIAKADAWLRAEARANLMTIKERHCRETADALATDQFLTSEGK